MCVIEPTCGSDFLCGHMGKRTAKAEKSELSRRRYSSATKHYSNVTFTREAFALCERSCLLNCFQSIWCNYVFYLCVLCCISGHHVPYPCSS